jgi:hypothetical protein
MHNGCVINLLRSNLEDDGIQNEEGNRDNTASMMTGDTKNDWKQQGMVLLEGHVRQYYTRLHTKGSVSYQYEERVHSDGTVAEAIRRCVWSTNHEMIDIFHLYYCYICHCCQQQQQHPQKRKKTLHTTIPSKRQSFYWQIVFN